MDLTSLQHQHSEAMDLCLHTCTSAQRILIPSEVGSWDRTPICIENIWPPHDFVRLHRTARYLQTRSWSRCVQKTESRGFQEAKKASTEETAVTGIFWLCPKQLRYWKFISTFWRCWDSHKWHRSRGCLLETDLGIVSGVGFATTAPKSNSSNYRKAHGFLAWWKWRPLSDHLPQWFLVAL